MSDLDAILKTILRDANRLFDTSEDSPYSGWSFQTFDEEEGLVVKAASGKTRGFEKEPATEGHVSYYVAKQRTKEPLEPLVVEDPDEFFSEHPELQRRRPDDNTPFVSAPVLENGSLVGVININYKEGEQIQDEHIDAIRSFIARPSEVKQLPILLIERNSELRESIEHTLEERGHLVETMEDVNQAIEYLKEGKEGNVRLIIASQQGPTQIKALYDGLELIDPGLPVVLCGEASSKPSRTTEIIKTVLSYAGKRPVRMPSLVSPATTESGMRKLAEVVEATLKRSDSDSTGPEREYFGVPTAAADDMQESIKLAMRLLADDPGNKSLRQFVSCLHAQQVVKGDHKGIRMYSPSRHLVYSIITSRDVGKIYRTGSRVAKIEERNYMFFGVVNSGRRQFLREKLGIDENYLILAETRGPPQRIDGHYLLTLARVDGDLLYQKCLDGKATIDDLKKVGIRLARFQVEGANGFREGNLELVDVVKAANYWPVTAEGKVDNQSDDGSIYFRNRLGDVFFGQLERGGIIVEPKIKEPILDNYFINRMLVQAHDEFAEYYVDGNPRDWIESYTGDIVVVTKIDLENDRLINGFMDIASLLEFGITEDGHTAQMSEEQKLDVLDRIMLENVRARAVIREDVDRIKAIDTFLEVVEGRGKPYSGEVTFYELLSADGTADTGKVFRRGYVAAYYAASCHKNPEWAGHKTKFSAEAARIIPDLSPDDPYKKELEVCFTNHLKERSRQVRRVMTSLDIMLGNDYVPADLLDQAQEFKDNWARMIDMHFQ